MHILYTVSLSKISIKIKQREYSSTGWGAMNIFRSLGSPFPRCRLACKPIHFKKKFLPDVQLNSGMQLRDGNTTELVHANDVKLSITVPSRCQCLVQSSVRYASRTHCRNGGIAVTMCHVRTWRFGVR